MNSIIQHNPRFTHSVKSCCLLTCCVCLCREERKTKSLWGFGTDIFLRGNLLGPNGDGSDVIAMHFARMDGGYEDFAIEQCSMCITLVE